MRAGDVLCITPATVPAGTDLASGLGLLAVDMAGGVPVNAGAVAGYGWRDAVPDRRVTGSGRPSAPRGREFIAPAVGVGWAA